MREIKFRAWNKVGKELIYFSLMGEGIERDCFIADEADGTGGYPTVDKSDVGDVQQYTGLKDKNGKEIYEGDYLQHQDGEVSVVEWLDGCFVVRHFWNKKPSDCDFIARKNNFEAIGNIYENPELLTK